MLQIQFTTYARLKPYGLTPYTFQHCLYNIDKSWVAITVTGELNGNVWHPANLTHVRWDDSRIITGIGHLSSHMVQQQIQSVIGSIKHHSFQKRCVSIASNPNICYCFIKWMGDIMSMKQWSLFTSTRGVYLLIIQTYVSVLKNGWVTLGPLSKTAWTVEPSWTAWTSEPHVPHEERSAGRTAPVTGRTILQPKAIRCSWY